MGHERPPLDGATDVRDLALTQGVDDDIARHKLVTRMQGLRVGGQRYASLSRNQMRTDFDGHLPVRVVDDDRAELERLVELGPKRSVKINDCPPAVQDTEYRSMIEDHIIRVELSVPLILSIETPNILLIHLRRH